MPFRMAEEGGAEDLPQAVWLCVQIGIDKVAPLHSRQVAQIKPDVAMLALEFGCDAEQRMPFCSLPHQLVWAVGAEDQNRAVSDLTAQVKKQAAGGSIDPVQVLQDQDEGSPLRNGLEHSRILGKKAVLLQRQARVIVHKLR